jgi:hypothetical protein
MQTVSRTQSYSGPDRPGAPDIGNAAAAEVEKNKVISTDLEVAARGVTSALRGNKEILEGAVDRGRSVGLVVDRVANVVTVTNDRIEAADAIQGAVDTDLMTGMIKASDSLSMVIILDAPKVVAREFVGKRLDKALAAGQDGHLDDRKVNVAGQ